MRVALEEGSPAAAPVAPQRGWFRWWDAVLAVLVLAGLAIAVVHFRETPPAAAPIRFQIPVPEKTRFGRGALAVSPDGRRLVFNANGADGRSMLWIPDTAKRGVLPGYSLMTN